MSIIDGDGDEVVLVLPVAADLERRLIMAQGLYPADRLFSPVPIGLEGRTEED